MKLKRVTLTIDLLIPAGESAGGMDLDSIQSNAMDGGWSMKGPEITSEVVLEGEQAIQEACDEHGTDLEFFFPDMEA